jgi:transposase
MDNMRKKYQHREEIVWRLKQPGSPSVSVMSEETGVPKPTLYAWLSSERRKEGQDTHSIGTVGMQKRIKPRTPSVKMALIVESFTLDGDALRTYCGSHGVMVEELLSWRDMALSGLELADREKHRVREAEHVVDVKALQAELRRKNAALAEAAALLILKKKFEDLFGEEK